jgi:hypothetical protein
LAFFGSWIIVSDGTLLALTGSTDFHCQSFLLLSMRYERRRLSLRGTGGPALGWLCALLILVSTALLAWPRPCASGGGQADLQASLAACPAMGAVADSLDADEPSGESEQDIDASSLQALPATAQISGAAPPLAAPADREPYRPLRPPIAA